MTTAETDRLVHYMPIIVRSADISPWERSFCASIIARSRRSGFTPTEKQVGVMRRLVDNFQRDQMRGDEPPELIEVQPGYFDAKSERGKNETVFHDSVTREVAG